MTTYRKGYIATVEILIHADSQMEACDGLSDLLRELQYDGEITDWGHKDCVLPRPTFIPDNYEPDDDSLSGLPVVVEDNSLFVERKTLAEVVQKLKDSSWLDPDPSNTPELAKAKKDALSALEHVKERGNG